MGVVACSPCQAEAVPTPRVEYDPEADAAHIYPDGGM